MSVRSLLPTLYSPATMEKTKLRNVINGGVKHVHRMVICTEDAVGEHELDDALSNLETVLQGFVPGRVDVFIRPRNLEVLRHLLKLEDITRVTGFVIPKAHPETFDDYASLIMSVNDSFRLMPILEHRQMASGSFREALLAAFEPYRHAIDTLRIGGNDLMGHQKLRRDDQDFTIHELTVGKLIADIVNYFRSCGGYDVSAPVFECIHEKYDELFMREVRQNIADGLFGQTVIAPRHLKILLNAYKVRASELESARAILAEQPAAVAQLHGRMDEPATHSGWAERILARANLFGVSE